MREEIEYEIKDEIWCNKLEELTKKSFEEELMRWRNDTSTGIDGIQVEILKKIGEEEEIVLRKILDRNWNKERKYQRDGIQP